MISARIDSLTSVHRTLVVVYNVPRCTMGKQGVRKEGYLQREEGRRGGGQSRGRRSIVYAATNSLRFAGVTYCPGAGARAATAYMLAPCMYTRSSWTALVHMLHILRELLCSLQQQRRQQPPAPPPPPLSPHDVFAESANYFARSLVAHNVVGLSGKWVSIPFRLAFSLVNGRANLVEMFRRLLKDPPGFRCFFLLSLSFSLSFFSIVVRALESRNVDRGSIRRSRRRRSNESGISVF